MPGLVGWSAVKRFGGNPLLGIVLGLMLIHPDLLNAYGYATAVQNHSVPQWHILGFTLEKSWLSGTGSTSYCLRFCLSSFRIMAQ